MGERFGEAMKRKEESKQVSPEKCVSSKDTRESATSVLAETKGGTDLTTGSRKEADKEELGQGTVKEKVCPFHWKSLLMN